MSQLRIWYLLSLVSIVASNGLRDLRKSCICSAPQSRVVCVEFSYLVPRDLGANAPQQSLIQRHRPRRTSTLPSHLSLAHSNHMLRLHRQTLFHRKRVHSDLGGNLSLVPLVVSFMLRRLPLASPTMGLIHHSRQMCRVGVKPQTISDRDQKQVYLDLKKTWYPAPSHKL